MKILLDKILHLCNTTFDMKMQWEHFEGKQFGRTARQEPRVTLGTRGTIYMNGIAYDAFERPAAVEMLFEGNRRVIGLKPIDPRRDNAFAVKHHGTKGSYQRISAAAFCTHHRLKYGRTLLFEKAEIDDEGVMRLDLTKATEVSRGSR
jgi:hypothetical protein